MLEPSVQYRYESSTTIAVAYPLATWTAAPPFFPVDQIALPFE